MLSENSYYTVRAWMVTVLGLQGDRLAVFAIIYTLSRKSSQWAYVTKGTLEMIADWIEKTVRHTKRIIKLMVEDKLLIVGGSPNRSYCQIKCNTRLIAS